MTGGAVVEANASRPLLSADLFELQRRMKWIGQPKRVILLGKLLNPGRQIIVAPPEFRVGLGLHFLSQAGRSTNLPALAFFSEVSINRYSLPPGSASAADRPAPPDRKSAAPRTTPRSDE